MSNGTDQGAPALAQRKTIELRQKLGSLCSEFQDWRELSETGQRFRKHHSQIRRLTASLDGYMTTLAGEVAAVQAAPQTALETCRKIEIDILMAHRLWDYFRRKLVLRAFDRFERFLFAADEFAWACYEPAQLKAADIPPERVKEPPLVYFHGAASPLASSRDVALPAAELAAGDKPPEELLNIFHALPIPIVGVPWFQIEHLPDALLLGHEVGHNVCDDFGLADRLGQLIDRSGVHPDRLPGWQAWKHEIFADFYGTLAGGPAFVGALIDFLATDPQTIATDFRDSEWWGEYPPGYVRVLLNLEYLHQLVPDFSTATLAAEWTASYPTHVNGAFVADLAPITRAFRDGTFAQFGGARFPDLLSFNEEQHQSADGCAADANEGLGVDQGNVRILFAAARLAYARSSEKYRHRKVADLLLDKVPRTTDIRAEDLRDNPALLKARVAADRKAGADLLRELRAARNPSRHP